MKAIAVLTAIFMHCGNLNAQQNYGTALLKGRFTDDYGIHYSISDTLWAQLPRTKYHIISWDTAAQYLVVKNDTANKTDKGLYTRIDYMEFKEMQLYTWGFCLTAYNLPTIEAATNTKEADRKNPRKGCNGFPFSRMKKDDGSGK